MSSWWHVLGENLADIGRCHAAQADPVDEYYKPLTRHERELAFRYGQLPPLGELLAFVRRWEQTVRREEAAGIFVGSLHSAINQLAARAYRALTDDDVDQARAYLSAIPKAMSSAVDVFSGSTLLDSAHVMLRKGRSCVDITTADDDDQESSSGS